MPDPNSVSAGAASGRLDFSNAPGADQDWDSLFPNPELAPVSQPQVASGTNPPQAPQAQPNQFYLASGDGKIAYRTAEDAIQGISVKDTEIARLRSFLKDSGVDPNTLQKAQPQAQPQSAEAHARFFDRVAEAATNRDKDAYENAFKEFIGGMIDPWRGTLAEMNRFKAYQQVSRELPGFKEFFENGNYNSTLEKNPLLKDMNQIGENDPIAAQRLPEVYRLAYFNFKATQPATEATAVTTTPTVRPQTTLQPSALTPPAPVVSTQGWAEASWRGVKPTGNDARKQLIRDGDTKFQNMRFEDVGL